MMYIALNAIVIDRFAFSSTLYKHDTVLCHIASYK